MIKFENTEVTGWRAAIRGMRNPLNSWAKSDSFCDFDNCMKCSDRNKCEWGWEPHKHPYRSTLHNFRHVGSNDLNLMKRLRDAGTDHRKYMRMIAIYADITAPLYWWKEYDTYKVGTVANSCSTMHKIHAKEFTLDDFSYEHLIGCELGVKHKDGTIPVCNPMQTIETIIHDLNVCRELYLETKDKKYWWQMIQLLPSSYNQKRTVMLNYETLANMYHSRKSHKLDEWRRFCDWIKTLPYSEIITGEE